ncbi:CesT family type III secretion system chaperone [Pseudomonas sp. 21LCFQ010]|uniref:type III secretion system chaperone n=1 Tax=Pseudomonas sp. 21LCFQ010 TaxID=2957506 RepID=UPI002096E476|nr:type III secretion system chaperone [Pseudomonas sp. 21LCFQ010]MCO8161122.1 CesT family type III secretion system chaperone [Pseudomonas sp. 21LCFQ010]
MKSAELIATVERWLDVGDAELALQVDEQLMRVRRCGSGLAFIAPLATAWRGDEAGLVSALKLSAASRTRFRAALALDPETRGLCLVQHQRQLDSPALLAVIEALANQRDVWASMLEAALPRTAAAPRRVVHPFSLGANLCSGIG